MGWSVSYELKRAEPLSDGEREALRAHVKKYARIKWEVERYELQFPDAGEIVARGITKMPWKTSHRNWASLLKALAELRDIVDGATCEVFDDQEVVEWDAAEKKYTIGGGGGDFDDFDSDEWKPSAGARWFTLERIEKSDPHGNVFIDSKKNVPRFEILDKKQEALVSMITNLRTAVAATVDKATLHLQDGDGRTLQTADIRHGARVRLEPGVGEKVAMLELTARTTSPCTSRTVARFTCGAITEPGTVELTTDEATLQLFPHVVTAMTCEWSPELSALGVDIDGRGPVMTPGHELEICVMACTDTGMELERARVHGSFTNRHSLTLAITAERVARVRRLEVRVNGALVQEARVAAWKLLAGGATPARGRSA